MIQRCENPNHRSFHRYGGRGIFVCPAWRSSFDLFIRDAGRRPSYAHSLDRIDNDGGYEPGNVRWATRKEQSRNSSVIRWLTLRGETMPLTDWAKRLGVPGQTITTRLARGWPVERALTQPASRIGNQARLTSSQVAEIRAGYTGARGECAALARRYGLSISSMLSLVTGQTWSLVTS
jgi:hypothetical protein